MTARPVLVMGICGTGKSTVARGIAERIGGTFIEAGLYHDPSSVARMPAGQPLTDDMRWGWLDRLAAEVTAAPTRAVLDCSALSRAHRDRLRTGVGPVEVVFLHGDRARIAARMAARMAARPDHYMPPSLIDSQLAALQPPDPTAEDALWVDVALPPTRSIDRAVAALTAPCPSEAPPADTVTDPVRPAGPKAVTRAAPAPSPGIFPAATPSVMKVSQNWGIAVTNTL